MWKKQTVKTRMQTLLDSLDYDFSHFTLEGFARWLAQARGRQIIFVPRHMPGSIFGGWVRCAGKDYIFYDADTPAVHQAHIQLHEMAHMLCGHSTVEVGAQEAQTLLLRADSIVPRVLESLLLRSVHSNEAEVEAEALASLIQIQVVKHNRLAELTKAISRIEPLASYMEALEV